MAKTLKGCRANQQNGRPTGRPRKPESSTDIVGPPIGRPISTVVDRSADRPIDRAQVTWACVRLCTPVDCAFDRQSK